MEEGEWEEEQGEDWGGGVWGAVDYAFGWGIGDGARGWRIVDMARLGYGAGVSFRGGGVACMRACVFRDNMDRGYPAQFN